LKRFAWKHFTSIAAMASVLCTVAAPLRAEEKNLTLSEIVAIAREHNGELKALRQEAGIGEAARIRAGLYPNPVFDLEAATGALTGSTSESRVSLGISQEFLVGGKRVKRLAVAESELSRYENRVKDAERLVLLEVKTGFYDLLRAASRLDLAHKSLDLNGELLRITRERLAAGDVAELEVNLARVEVARSEGSKIEAERELAPARQRLLALMGRPGLTDLKTAGYPKQMELLVPYSAELNSLALKNRPDLKAAEAEKGKGEAEHTLAQAERFGNLNAGIAFSRESSRTSLGGLAERSDDYLIGLKLSVPIPLSDRNQAGIKEARARISGAETRHSLLRQGIEREVAAAQARLAGAEKSLEIYANDIIPQLTENLKLVREAYSLGELGILAVIEEQKKFTEVNDGYLTALYNWNTAVAKLEAAVAVELKKEDGGNK
jgi:cobalt-zinc-cadmium efflux system outer membrane protein